jgi:hypothetical protein
MLTTQDKVLKLSELGFVWNGKEYQKDDIKYTQTKIFSSSDIEFNKIIKSIKNGKTNNNTKL